MNYKFIKSLFIIVIFMHITSFLSQLGHPLLLRVEAMSPAFSRATFSTESRQRLTTTTRHTFFGNLTRIAQVQSRHGFALSAVFYQAVCLTIWPGVSRNCTRSGCSL